MSLQEAFDVIVEDMAGVGEGIRGFSGCFTHERSPTNGGLTAALFAVKMLGADGLRAFYDKGGRFTDQCDAEGRDARMILEERLRDGLWQQNLQAQNELRENLAVFEALVTQQGGLIHVEERRSFRLPWSIYGAPDILKK